MFVAFSTVTFKNWQAQTAISIFFIFQGLVYRAFWSTYSQRSYYQRQCLSTSTYRVLVVHPLYTENTLVSLATASSIDLIFGLQHFSRIGHTWTVYSNIWNPCWKHFFIKKKKGVFYQVLTIIKVSGYVQFLTKKKVSVYCVLYIATSVLILPVTELSATSVCWKRLFTASSRSTEALCNWGYTESSSLYKPLLLSLPSSLSWP